MFFDMLPKTCFMIPQIITYSLLPIEIDIMLIRLSSDTKISVNNAYRNHFLAEGI